MRTRDEWSQAIEAAVSPEERLALLGELFGDYFELQEAALSLSAMIRGLFKEIGV